ncbi:ASKHA domain-containing protein [Salsipaludibacter albus]|uniref:ASKHA domain-containing protein n=1 Tax=Salsipaludibacter albus TaxID=2849650 RepID=UPI001EE4A443|nr:ASKHA domain-containing protein [Salsipaludibacter albus]MBY5163394.1 DUF4445 domain-containing protein [Salsipaludibacter albus]
MSPTGSDRVAVTFTPSGRRGELAAGTTVLDAARELGVDLDSVCGGRGICGRCQVAVGSRPGTDARADRLSAPGPTEATYADSAMGARRPLEGRRLGCATAIHDDVVLDVPAASQVHRQVVRKEVGDLRVTLDPVVRPFYVEVPASGMDERVGEWQALQAALADQWELDEVSIGVSALADLQAALEDGDRAVTVAVRTDDGELVAAWPGFVDRLVGVAVDVGSTTIAGHLCDLTTGRVLASAGRMNPQIAFGEDLMSRVSHVMMHDDGQRQLTTAVRTALAELVAELCDEAGVTTDRVLDVVAVGNPIMHHLLYGLDPRPLGAAPFTLATTDAVQVTAHELDLHDLPRGARVWSPPCVAGHIGADAMSMTLADGLHRRDELSLLIDVGTNAEIVLGSAERVWAASSPTGPAFEGAQISSGQRAAPGAIERVRIDPQTLVPRVRVIGSDLWSDESGFADAVAATGVTGICGSGIIEVLAELHLAGVITVDGTIVDPTGTGAAGRIVTRGRTLAYRLHGDIEVTQNDVRAIQLAKAALQAGCRLLMAHAGVGAVDRIRLAGAFGSHIDPLRAMVLGLVPDCDPAAVSAIGNAAGTGAVQALLSRAARDEVTALAGRVVKVETATEAAFQDEFVGAMGLPHTSAPYPRLEAVVPLPRSRPSHGAGAGADTAPRRRRRRRATTP